MVVSGAVGRGAECTCLLCIATPSGEQLLHELSTDAGSLDHVSLGCCEDDIVKQLLMRLHARRRRDFILST